MLRTSPRLLDLLAALATGLAGAFAIGRRDVSDTLPGVAIAISLVPPLANAGILFSAGRPDLAYGSLLLFVTNYLAIVLTGALVFGLMGFPRVAFVGRSKRGRRLALAIVIVTLLFVMVPLAYTSLTVFANQSAEAVGTTAVTSWLKGSTLNLSRLRLTRSSSRSSSPARVRCRTKRLSKTRSRARSWGVLFGWRRSTPTALSSRLSNADSNAGIGGPGGHA